MKRFIKGFLATVALISFSGLYSAEAQTTYTIGGSASGLLCREVSHSAEQWQRSSRDQLEW